MTGRNVNPDAIARAREAVARQAWDEAVKAFAVADRTTEMDPEDLVQWAMAAYLLGKVDVSTEALSRAYQRFMVERDLAQAVRAGFWMIYILLSRGDMAQAGGWIGRCSHVLEQLPPDAVEHGYMLALRSFRHAALEHNYQMAYETAEKAVDAGRRGDDPDLVALSLNNGGRALVRLGKTEEGMGWLDEAMVAVVSGELSATVAGTVYCSLIEACEEISELRRAKEWTEALTRWCDGQQGMLTFNGQCLTHRAMILRRHGDWTAAADEAVRACEKFRGAADEIATGRALYQLAEIKRVSGDEEEAEELYRQASEWGHDPQPGLALLRLAQGKVDSAAGAMRRSMAEAHDRIDRVRLLPAFVEVMLAAEDVDAASSAAGILREIATKYRTTALEAEADLAQGAVHVKRGEPEAALHHLRQAHERWRLVEAPYEAARTRMLIGLACRDLGDQDTANLELEAARQALTDLGAGSALTELDRITGVETGPTHPLTERELEVLRLVATGMTNRDIADQLYVAVKTVDRHVGNILTKLGVGSRTAATAYAYENELV